MDLSFGLRFQYVNVFLRICILQECKPKKMDTSTTQTVLACGPWWLVLYHILCSQGIAMWVWESLKLHWLILRPLPRKAGCGDRRCRSWKWPNESTNSTFCCFFAHEWLRNCFYIGFSLEVFWILEAINKKRDEWYQAEFKLIHIHRYLRYPWGRYVQKIAVYTVSIFSFRFVKYPSSLSLCQKWLGRRIFTAIFLVQHPGPEVVRPKMVLILSSGTRRGVLCGVVFCYPHFWDRCQNRNPPKPKSCLYKINQDSLAFLTNPRQWVGWAVFFFPATLPWNL